MQDSRRQFLAAAAAGVTGLLAGCGGNGSATPTRTDEATATEATATDTESTMTATESATDTGSEATATESDAPPTLSLPAQTVAVGDDGFQFTPETFEISVGETVWWEWEGSGHNVRPDDIPAESNWSGTEGGDGETYGNGHIHSHTFEAAGEYSYYCAPHQGAGMTGSFTVTQ